MYGKKKTIQEPFFANPRVPIGRTGCNGSCKPHWCQPKPVAAARFSYVFSCNAHYVKILCIRVHNNIVFYRKKIHTPPLWHQPITRSATVHTAIAFSSSKLYFISLPPIPLITLILRHPFANLKPRLLTAEDFFYSYPPVAHPPNDQQAVHNTIYYIDDMDSQFSSLYRSVFSFAHNRLPI